MNALFAPLRLLITLVFGSFLLGLLAVVGAYLYVAPQLPDTEAIRDVRFQVPLRVFTREGALIAEFGEQRREPVVYDQVPELMRQAFMAAEDERFETHPGVDPVGLLRAAVNLVTTGEKSQGGSTITMQVARNFFLQRDKTYTRKITEIFLALRMEREFSKEEILELYLNKIFMGQRAYGVAAASKVYYGVDLDQLTLPQIAMIAGLPQAPSAANPISNPARATARRNYVLGRMHDLGYITSEEYAEALATPDDARLHAAQVEVSAGHLAEMVRLRMVELYGEAAYTEGFRVYTSLDGGLQEAAKRALRAGLLAYDRRHGYRGPEARVDLSGSSSESDWDGILARHPRSGGNLVPGLVVAASGTAAEVYLGAGKRVSLNLESVSWARAQNPERGRAPGPAPTQVSSVLAVGDLIRVVSTAPERWELSQIPEVEGSLVALDPHDGAILGLVGGFDFHRSNFNRAIRADRQPGSAFKPFIYSAAFELGYSPATMVNDAPVVVEDLSMDSDWRPRNFTGRFYGPTRLREAMIHSRNLVSIRLLDEIGIVTAHDFLNNFGFDTRRHPRALSLSLGSGVVTPLELTRAYAVFASGGLLVEPWFIQRIEGLNGEILHEHQSEAPVRTLPEENAYQVTSMLQDVITSGTAQRARSLGRPDLAGKTGTTNDMRDAWFAGYNADLVATAWVGFDQNHPLGARESGAASALPIWIEFMGEALRDRPQSMLREPGGMVTLRIDAETGHTADSQSGRTLFESFTPRQLERLRAGESGRRPENVTTEIEDIF